MDKRKKIIAFALSVGVLAVAGAFFMNGGTIGSLSSSVLDKPPSAMSDNELNAAI